MIAIVAVLGVATLVVLVAWGLRVIHDIEDLEDLSARVVGTAAELRPAWMSASEDRPSPNRARNVRIHPAAFTGNPDVSRAAS